MPLILLVNYDLLYHIINFYFKEFVYGVREKGGNMGLAVNDFLW